MSARPGALPWIARPARPAVRHRRLAAGGTGGVALALVAGAAASRSAGFADALSAALGAGLVVIAWSLLRGRRRAPRLAAAALIGAAVIGVARHDLDGLPLVELGLSGYLLAHRWAFPVPTRESRVGWRASAGLLALAAAAAFAVAVAALDARRAMGLEAAVSHAGAWLVHGGWWMRDGTPFALSLNVLAAIAAGAGAALLRSLLLPVEGADGHSAAMHRRAAGLVQRHGEDSLDPFSLREDKSFHFAHNGFLAYRVLAGMAVVSGDPVAPPGAAPLVLASFERHALDRGWTVVLTGASGRHVDGYRELGFRALRIGEEAVVDPCRFTLEGRAMRKVRQSVHRATRRGWTTEVVEARDLCPRTVRELQSVELRWRASQPRLHGFAMTLGRLWGAAEDVNGVYVLAREESGEVRGFLRFASYRRGLSLDVMRRPAEAPNGLNEAMVAAALAYARERDAAEVSLNFAGFAHVMAAGAALTRGQRVLRFGLNRLHGRFQLERLVRFNDKFEPDWRPRYLVHRGRAVLPLAAVRVLQAEAYLRPPPQCLLERRWRPLPEPVLPEPGAVLS